MAFSVRKTRTAERNALVNRGPVADFGGLADDHAHPVIDEHPFADFRRRMNLDAGQKTHDLRQEAGQHRHARDRLDQPMRDDRVETGIRKHDVEPAARCRVALDRRPQIG
jgi:hypothetical protein